MSGENIPDYLKDYRKLDTDVVTTVGGLRGTPLVPLEKTLRSLREEIKTLRGEMADLREVLTAADARIQALEGTEGVDRLKRLEKHLLNLSAHSGAPTQWWLRPPDYNH